MKDKKYVIEADGFEELAVKLAYVMKLHNEELARKAKEEKREGPPPRIDVMRLSLTDGSKVSVSLSKKPSDVLAKSCRRGIQIDGFMLG